MTVGGQREHEINKVLSSDRYTGKAINTKTKPCSDIIPKTRSLISLEKENRLKHRRSKTL